MAEKQIKTVLADNVFNIKQNHDKKMLAVDVLPFSEERYLFREDVMTLINQLSHIATLIDKREYEEDEKPEEITKCVGINFQHHTETFLTQLRRVGMERSEKCFKIEVMKSNITYWTTALVGEFGELCNMVKKLERVCMGGTDGGHSYSAKDITKEMLEEEIGGTALYLDLVAARLGINLEEAIVKTFNAKSLEHEWPYLLVAETPGTKPGTAVVLLEDLHALKIVIDENVSLPTVMERKVIDWLDRCIVFNSKFGENAKVATKYLVTGYWTQYVKAGYLIVRSGGIWQVLDGDGKWINVSVPDSTFNQMKAAGILRPTK